jgi:hypothetical protein
MSIPPVSPSGSYYANNDANAQALDLVTRLQALLGSYPPNYTQIQALFGQLTSLSSSLSPQAQQLISELQPFMSQNSPLSQNDQLQEFVLVKTLFTALVFPSNPNDQALQLIQQMQMLLGPNSPEENQVAKLFFAQLESISSSLSPQAQKLISDLQPVMSESQGTFSASDQMRLVADLSSLNAVLANS